MKFLASTFVLAMTALTLQASAFVLPAHRILRMSVAEQNHPLMSTALDLVRSDFQRVMDVSLRVSDEQPQLLVGTVSGPMATKLAATGVDLTPLQEEAQAFIVAVAPSGQLVVAGSDVYGVAYGLMELSRQLGVSPLTWWADVDVEPRSQLSLDEGFLIHQTPHVSFRGIHVDDVTWGLQPWLTRTFDPGAAYTIDRKITRHIFELLLRLRLNLFWPPTDESSRAFLATPEARSLAESYGIFLGTDVEQPIGPEDLVPRIMCTDDGFGYLTRFPSYEESQDDRGCGVYYHASYSGGPHDYLWLGTASPFLMFQQLSEAFYHGARRLWVLNVGDIKPSEYQLSLFADMAWDLNAVRELTIGRHLEEFFAANVARDIARLASIYMKEFYHLSFQCKPEHLAGTRVDEPDGESVDWNKVRDLPWSEKRIRHRLTRFDLMRRNVEWLADSVRHAHPSRYDAFFELVEYPVMAVINQNLKYLLAQLARHGISWLSKENVDETWRRCDIAHNRVQELTLQYNALRGGKWQGILSSNPAGRQVFQPVPHTRVQSALPQDVPTIATFYGASYNASSFSGSSILDPVLGLGASIRAMPIPKDCNVTYKFKHNFGKERYVIVKLHLLPTHPIQAEQRFTLSLDGGAPLTFTYDTEVGSEEWKTNVLRNFAVVQARIPVTRATGEHQLVVSALDDGVVVDELFVYKAQGNVEF